jgi:hypothetical protein
MKWGLATAYSDSEFQARNVRMFADDVKKRSGGKLEIMGHAFAPKAVLSGGRRTTSIPGRGIGVAPAYLLLRGQRHQRFQIDRKNSQKSSCRVAMPMRM